MQPEAGKLFLFVSSAHDLFFRYGRGTLFDSLPVLLGFSHLGQDHFSVANIKLGHVLANPLRKRAEVAELFGLV